MGLLVGLGRSVGWLVRRFPNPFAIARHLVNLLVFGVMCNIKVLHPEHQFLREAQIPVTCNEVDMWNQQNKLRNQTLWFLLSLWWSQFTLQFGATVFDAYSSRIYFVRNCKDWVSTQIRLTRCQTSYSNFHSCKPEGYTHRRQSCTKWCDTCKIHSIGMAWHTVGAEEDEEEMGLLAEFVSQDAGPLLAYTN